MSCHWIKILYIHTPGHLPRTVQQFTQVFPSLRCHCQNYIIVKRCVQRWSINILPITRTTQVKNLRITVSHCLCLSTSIVFFIGWMHSNLQFFHFSNVLEHKKTSNEKLFFNTWKQQFVWYFLYFVRRLHFIRFVFRNILFK